ncbi:recombinase family protein [Streptomyces sp. NPDC090445]|uniref:recombinase family protein n=1 Tax=Streptomyces sp. NPDC090445 TaxID=3365963 RepID=UPI003816C4FE
MGESFMSAINVASHTMQYSTLRAVDYLRVSTEEQAKGYGIAYTGKRTAAHILRKGWAHVDTFMDEGESGTLPWEQRDGATKIMDLAVQAPRPFDLVCVYETRAVGRQNRVFWEWVWKLQDLGIFVAVVDEDIDNTTEDGEARMRDMANEGASGRWERVMSVMEGCDGAPVAPRHPLPKLEMTGKVRPGVILAVSDLECHAQESGPSAAACCS